MSIIIEYSVISIHCLFIEPASVLESFYLNGKVLILQENSNSFPWMKVEYTTEGKCLITVYCLLKNHLFTFCLRSLFKAADCCDVRGPGL